ncbi:membrane protein insertase YidC [Uliginosibacterium sp. H3]|uniref:Membrane protein insertase YidC n=1 Tax=Uliginosibacterium silvisoli TaxID=3114758 RepID=A0ABU6JZE4_9RHOO|nr:membrane protein insertase YidC [Uliginosibacterium sp. H3]
MDPKRLVLSVIFAVSVFILWENWNRYSNPPQPVTAASQAGSAASQGVPSATPGLGQSAAVAAPGAVAAVPATGTVADYKSQPRAVVKTDMIRAEVSALGGDIVHLELLKHKATGDLANNFVILDEGKVHTYIARSGLLGQGLPDHRTVFTLSTNQLELKDGQDSIELRLQAPAAANGVSVTKVLRFHRGSYVVDVSYELANTGPAALQAQAYFELARDGAAAEHTGGMIGGVSTFTGPARYTEAKHFEKIAFSDIDKGKDDSKDVTTKDGWIAMVQHYFVSAFLPKGDVERVFFTRKIADNFYGTGVKISVAVAAGQKTTVDMPLYVGPQEQKKLKALAPGLDLVVDYGWVTMIAVPLFWLLSFIHGVVGNWGWAIILLTILIKAVFFPLSAASYRSMAKMKTLMPKMKAIQERYASDKMKMNQEMMQLYKTEKVNPMGGCLPILVQIPVFMALYWTLLGAVEMRQAPWIGWIHDLSAMDPFYVLPVIMAVTMFIQSKLNPTPPDPVQAKVMMAMPLIFGVMFLWMPSGLVLYWVVNNTLSIAQQWQITRMIEGGKSK